MQDGQSNPDADALFPYSLLVVAAVIVGLVLLVKYFGAKHTASAPAAVVEAVAAFSPWFPLR